MSDNAIRTVRQHCIKRNMDLLTLERWLYAEGLDRDAVTHKWPPLSDELVDKIWEKHRNQRYPGADPQTGLTGRQRLELAKAIEQERKNEIEAKVAAEEWISRDTVFAMIKAIADSLEQLPGKVRSEAGLTDDQANVLRRAVDEARKSAENKIGEVQ